MILRLFKDIFREVDAFDYKCEVLMELRLFKSDVRLFQRIRGFLKLFPDRRRLFSLMWEILKDFEAF
jgi:hypothetical protein